MNNKQYRIVDWAGNDKSNYYGRFKSFEDAWERLYQEFPNDGELPEDDQYLQEFYVEKVEL